MTRSSVSLLGCFSACLPAPNGVLWSINYCSGRIIITKRKSNHKGEQAHVRPVIITRIVTCYYPFHVARTKAIRRTTFEQRSSWTARKSVEPKEQFAIWKFLQCSCWNYVPQHCHLSVVEASGPPYLPINRDSLAHSLALRGVLSRHDVTHVAVLEMSRSRSGDKQARISAQLRRWPRSSRTIFPATWGHSLKTDISSWICKTVKTVLNVPLSYTI